MSGMLKRLIIVVVVLAVLFVGLRIWARIFPEWLWFSSESINLSSVYWTMLKTKLGLGIGFGLLFLALALGNAFLLWKFALRRMADEDVMSVGGAEIPLGRRLFVGVILLLCFFGAIIAGFLAVTQWEPYLRYTRSDGLSFSQQDPIFEKDIAYYVFRMPFLRFVRGWLFGAFLVLTAGTGVIYLLLGDPGARERRARLSVPMRTHLFILSSAALLLLAWGRVFAKYELLATETTVHHGWVYGVGYVDHLIRIPVQNILMGIAIITAVLFLISIFVRGMTRLALGGIALFVVVSIVGGIMVPWAMQRFRVDPQELDKEEQYIKHNIDYTRSAYNLNKVEEKAYKGTGALTLEDITRNKAIMQNIRLWDWRPLRDTFKQLETRRPQYDFVDVDIDRYMVDGQVRQVMLSPRELIFEKVENKTWVNRTFVYTHGYGITMVPVSEIEPGGLPRMYVNDIPPQVHAPWNQNIQQPEIYCGEGEPAAFRSEMGILPYVIVDPEASEPEEFDYPGVEEDALTSYKGIDGVPLTGFWRRLAYAFKFSSDMKNILFSGKINPTSKILLHRSISERVRAIAPFLKYDKDPYMVVSKGRLFWIQDAYTATHMYPYSEPMEQEITAVMELGRQRISRTDRERVWGNYIRNSVKVVIDAYNGTVKYYVMTGEEGQGDPIAECYSRIFPDLFTDFREMDPDLKQHIRYPQTLFMIQAEKYTRYHMNEPKQFYRKEDVWQFSTEKMPTGESPGERTVEPYYVVLQLPNSDKEEFMLMLPFTPLGKKNMRAWLAAKCDPGQDGDMGEYGNLLLYALPKGEELIYGTIQVEADIDQNDKMSGQLSLWDTLGSSVIRGNLLAIPIKDSMLYVEPIYLQAETAAIPQLKRVVVALGSSRLDWGENLESALAALYGSAPLTESVAETKVSPAGVETTSISTQELSKQALKQLNKAEEELSNLKETLRKLQEAGTR